MANDNVSDIIIDSVISNGLMILIYMTISVFVEEFFFRAFLVDRIGVILSTIIFALMHIGYNSVFELFGALVLGFVIALFWQKERDFLVIFIGHLCYNLFIIALVLNGV